MIVRKVEKEIKDWLSVSQKALLVYLSTENSVKSSLKIQSLLFKISASVVEAFFVGAALITCKGTRPLDLLFPRREGRERNSGSFPGHEGNPCHFVKGCPGA